MKPEIESKIAQIEKLTGGMDVPDCHHRSIVWLDKNLRVRNSNHKDYMEVRLLLDELMAMGIR